MHLVCKGCCVLRGSDGYGSATYGEYQNLCSSLACGHCDGTDCSHVAEAMPNEMPKVLRCGDIEPYVKKRKYQGAN